MTDSLYWYMNFDIEYLSHFALAFVFVLYIVKIIILSTTH